VQKEIILLGLTRNVHWLGFPMISISRKGMVVLGALVMMVMMMMMMMMMISQKSQIYIVQTLYPIRLNTTQ